MARPKKIIEAQDASISQALALMEPHNEVVEAQKPEQAKIVTQLTAWELGEIEDRKPVTGTFTNKHKPGVTLRIGAIRKYKGDPLTPRIFEDGKVYTIPKWLADWLNGVAPEQNPMKTPSARKIIHQDQHNNLQERRPLSDPKYSQMYAFTPLAKW